MTTNTARSAVGIVIPQKYPDGTIHLTEDEYKMLYDEIELWKGRALNIKPFPMDDPPPIVFVGDVLDALTDADLRHILAHLLGRWRYQTVPLRIYRKINGRWAYSDMELSPELIYDVTSSIFDIIHYIRRITQEGFNVLLSEHEDIAQIEQKD